MALSASSSPTSRLPLRQASNASATSPFSRQNPIGISVVLNPLAILLPQASRCADRISIESSRRNPLTDSHTQPGTVSSPGPVGNCRCPASLRSPQRRQPFPPYPSGPPRWPARKQYLPCTAADAAQSQFREARPERPQSLAGARDDRDGHLLSRS